MRLDDGRISSLASQLRQLVPACVVLTSVASLTACLSPLAIHRAVIEYDRTVHRVEAEVLLLNIARARHHQTLHFTGVTSVAATFDFRTNVGLSGELFGNPTSEADKANLLKLNLGATVAENPTVTIVPIQGEEFTRRILSQMDETKFWFLYRQEQVPAQLLRLMAREVQVDAPETREPLLYHNLPHHPDEYREFRQRLLHLSALDLQHKLHVGPLVYQDIWQLPLEHPLTSQALDKGYQQSRPSKEQPPILSKPVVGRLVVTNYDVAQVSNEERLRLDEEAQRYPRDHILVDIRPGYPGGNYPWRGRIELRSFYEILEFIARGIAEESEFDVEPDPRTGPVSYNPARTLEIAETDVQPPDAGFSIQFEGRWYSIKKSDDIQGTWNHEAFRILSQLYQMTVTEIAKVPTLPITIAK